MRLRNHHGNLFIANLPANFPEERLAEAFDPFGIVLSAEVARDPVTGNRLRYGWVDIATERAATAAIAGLHGTQLDGSRIEVRPSERPARKGAAAPRRPAPRRAAVPALSRPQAAAADADAAALPAAPAARPTFVVERRPLPRRIVIPARSG